MADNERSNVVLSRVFGDLMYFRDRPVMRDDALMNFEDLTVFTLYRD